MPPNVSSWRTGGRSLASSAPSEPPDPRPASTARTAGFSAASEASGGASCLLAAGAGILNPSQLHALCTSDRSSER